MTVREVPAKTDPAIPGPPRARITIDTAALKKALRRAVKGEVRFDPGTLAMYANDASNYRQVPIGVVVPKTLDDVVAAHRVCHRFGAPVLNRGGGTSLSGETVNYAVVIDHSKYLTGVGKIDAKRRLVTCEPGVINEELNRHTGKHGLVFGPDPSSHSRCVIGGNIGNNSCGIHSVQAQLYGPGPRTSDNVHALEVVTYDGARFWVGNGEEEHLDKIIAKGGRKGQIYAALRDLRDRYADQIRARYPSVTDLPRRVSGYNLDELLPEKGFNVARALTGTESTCVTVLRSTLMLTPGLFERTLVLVGYLEIADAAEHCMEIIEQWRPIGLEALDEELIHEQQQQHKHVEDIAELPKDGSRAWLLVQFGADTAEESEDDRAPVRRVADRGQRLRSGPDRDRGEQAGGRLEPGHLGDPRGRPRLHRVRARRGQLAWLGGLRGAAGQAGRLRRRPARADEPARAQGRDVRALRAGLHPLPAQLRPADRRRTRELPRVHGRGRRPGHRPTAARCQGSMATASSAPSCWKSSTGRSWSRRCGSSSGSGTRTGR